MKKYPCRRMQWKVFMAALFMGTLPVMRCSGGNCLSCFGCIGVGGLAIGLGLWGKIGQMLGRMRKGHEAPSMKPEI